MNLEELEKRINENAEKIITNIQKIGDNEKRIQQKS